MARISPTTTAIMAQAGMPNRPATPAMPLSWVTIAPRQATIKVVTESQGPALAEALANQFAMAAAGDQAQPQGQFLDHEQDRDQDQLQGQELVAPLGPALGGGDDAAGVGVGEHDQKARPDHRHPVARTARTDRRRLGFAEGGQGFSLAGPSLIINRNNKGNRIRAWRTAVRHPLPTGPVPL